MMILKIGTVKPCLHRFQHSVYLDSHKNMTIQVSHKKFSISKIIKFIFKKLLDGQFFVTRFLPHGTAYNVLRYDLSIFEQSVVGLKIIIILIVVNLK